MHYYYIVSFLGEGRNKLHLSTYYVTAIVVSALYELSHFWSLTWVFSSTGQSEDLARYCRLKEVKPNCPLLQCGLCS